jgi:hypothetical protein
LLSESAKLRIFYDNFAEGDRLLPHIDQMIRRCRTFLICLGSSGLTDGWQQKELGIALDAATIGGSIRIVPVLLPDADLAAIPESLKHYVWADFREGIDDPIALEGLVRTIRSSQAAQLEPAVDDQPPYRGLSAFTERDARFYFGRRRELDQVIGLLDQFRLLLIVGPSGAGKSSFARAGLVPELNAGRVRGSERWDIVFVSPGPDPFTAVFDEINDIRRPTIVFIDPLEEVFTRCHDDLERQSFFDKLAYTLSDMSRIQKVVMIVRSDYLAALHSYGRKLNLSYSATFTLLPMSDEQLREAIERPALATGIAFEPGLIERIMSDIGQSPARLPLAQITLQKLWEERREGWLTNDSYDRLGGAQRPLSWSLETFLETTHPDDRPLVRRIIRQLVGVVGNTYVRRRAKLSELTLGDEQAERISYLVEKLVDAHLVAVDGTVDGTYAELTHDSLLASNGVLLEWLEDDREFIQFRNWLRSATDEWLSASGSERGALLLRAAKLAQAKSFSERYPDGFAIDEVAFVQASESARTRQRVRVLTAVLIGVILLASMSLVAFMQSNLAMTEQLRSQLALNRVNELQARTGVTLASADGNWLFRRTSVGYEVINTHNAKVRLSLPNLPTVSASAFSPDGQFFAAAFDNGAVNYWNLRADNPTERFLSNLDITRQLTFSPSGRLLAAAGDFQLVVWEVSDGMQTLNLPSGSNILYLRFESDDVIKFTNVEGLEKTVDIRTGAIIADSAKNAGPAVDANKTGTKSYRVCIGEFERFCLSPVDAFLDCGASVADWAKARCSSYSLVQLSSRSGNRCGYSVIQVLCK